MNRQCVFLLSLLSIFPNALVAQTRYLSEVFNDVIISPDVKYGENISIFPPPNPILIDLVMDVYEPDGDVLTQRPLIVFIHGGYFLPPYINGTPTGSKHDSATVEMCKQFAKRGYVVANIDHRLGWNPAGSTVDIRKGTFLNAIYRSIQDVKACVRFFRKDAATANLYKIDPGNIIIGGHGSGGYIALNFISFDKSSEILIPALMSSTGQPLISQSHLGDFEGYGGNPLFNNPNNSPGYQSNVHFAFNIGGGLCDSSLIESGDAPTVAFHSMWDPFTPYNIGSIVIGNTPLPILNVAGSRYVLQQANFYGNNDCFVNSGFNDAYTNAANILNEGFEGLFPFATIPPTQTGLWEWFDSLTVVNEAVLVGQNGTTIYTNALLTNPDMSKGKALAYIDTIMNYVNPRIVYCLGLSTGINSIETAQNLITISPNPVSDKINIDLSKISNRIQTIAVYDVSGRKVKQVALSEVRNYTINRGDLNSGTYFLKVELENGEVNKKVVIQ